MNKKIVMILLCAIIVIAAIVISVVFIGNNRDSLSRMVGWTSSVEKRPLPPMPEIPKNPYELTPDAELVEKYENSDSEVFEYTLKEEYFSREEVRQEQTNLSACLIEFQSNLYAKLVPTDVVKQKGKELEPLFEKLREWESKFPPSEDEIYHRKLQHFYTALTYFVGEYRYQLEHFFDDNTEIIERMKVRYEVFYNAKEDFESGKITIDQALEQVEIKVDEYGEIIYNISGEEIETEYIYE